MEMAKRALIITGKMVQDHEFIYPYYRLKEEGYKIVVVIKDGKETTGFLGSKIPCDNECEIISYLKLGLDCEDYFKFDLLILPGGAKCMEYLRQERTVINFISNFKNRIGCICHGTQLLISAKRTKGLIVSGYYSIEDDIVNSGGEYRMTVVDDKNIVSCPHYKYLGQWMKKILKK